MTRSAPLIAHLWSDYSPGQVTEPHQHLLARKGFSSALIAARFVENEAARLPQTFSMERTDVAALTSDSLARKASSWLGRGLYWRRFNRFAWSHVRELHPDLLHAHFGYTGFRMLPLAKRSGLPLIVMFYGVDASALLKSPRWVRRYQQLFTRAALLVVLCDAVKERLIKIGCPPEKIRIWNIPAGIEFYPYRPRRPTGTFRFVIAARFVEKKGYPYLLEAFRKVLDAGIAARLTMIGYGSPDPIWDGVKQWNLEDHVQLIDTRLSPQFPSLYRDILEESDIFVLPSVTAEDGDDEGGPSLTLVCAQAAGLPVICTDFPGSEVSVIDGVTGLVCPQRNAAALATRMIDLAKKPDRWNLLGEKAALHVQQQFSLDGQIALLCDMYKDALARLRS